MTGEGIILNTSFNLAGEPLVETPTDAIKSYHSAASKTWRTGLSI
jgi:predicted NodU family carbamoyl transferase